MTDLTVLVECSVAGKQTCTDDKQQPYKPYKNEYIA